MRHFNVFSQEILVNPLDALKLSFLMFVFPTGAGRRSGDSDVNLERLLCVPLR